MKKFIYLFAITTILSSCGNSGPSELEASVIIQEFVKEKLKSPSTAKFEYGMVNSVKKIDENTYEVDSYVDAQNGFGGTVRTNFECEVKYDSGNWKLLKLDME